MCGGERPLVTIMMLVIGVVMAVILGGFVFGWFSAMLGGHPDFQIYDVHLYYDPSTGNSWGYFRLKNTGTIDIVGVEAYVIKFPNGTAPATPYTVTLDPGSTPTPSAPLKKGDGIQVTINGLGASSVGEMTLRFKVLFSGAKPIVKEYSYRAQSP